MPIIPIAGELRDFGQVLSSHQESKIGGADAVTMAIYTEAPSDATRDALRKLSDWLA